MQAPATGSIIDRLKSREAAVTSVTTGKAEHADDNYDFVRKKKAKARETTDYNADLVSNLYPLIVSTVVDFLEGGPIGAVEAGIAGLLPGADQVLGSIPRAVVGALHGRL